MAMRIPLEYIDYSLMFGANVRPWVELWACPKSWILSLAICEGCPTLVQKDDLIMILIREI